MCVCVSTCCKTLWLPFKNICFERTVRTYWNFKSNKRQLDELCNIACAYTPSVYVTETKAEISDVFTRVYLIINEILVCYARILINRITCLNVVLIVVICQIIWKFSFNLVPESFIEGSFPSKQNWIFLDLFWTSVFSVAVSFTSRLCWS